MRWRVVLLLTAALASVHGGTGSSTDEASSVAALEQQASALGIALPPSPAPTTATPAATKRAKRAQAAALKQRIARMKALYGKLAALKQRTTSLKQRLKAAPAPPRTRYKVVRTALGANPSVRIALRLLLAPTREQPDPGALFASFRAKGAATAMAQPAGDGGGEAMIQDGVLRTLCPGATPGPKCHWEHGETEHQVQCRGKAVGTGAAAASKAAHAGFAGPQAPTAMVICALVLDVGRCDASADDLARDTATWLGAAMRVPAPVAAVGGAPRTAFESVAAKLEAAAAAPAVAALRHSGIVSLASVQFAATPVVALCGGSAPAPTPHPTPTRRMRPPAASRAPAVRSPAPHASAAAARPPRRSERAHAAAAAPAPLPSSAAVWQAATGASSRFSRGVRNVVRAHALRHQRDTGVRVQAPCTWHAGNGWCGFQAFGWSHTDEHGAPRAPPTLASVHAANVGDEAEAAVKLQVAAAAKAKLTASEAKEAAAALADVADKAKLEGPASAAGKAAEAASVRQKAAAWAAGLAQTALASARGAANKAVAKAAAAAKVAAASEP